ncbi:hypothetical protein [Actinomadura sp. WMMA1423]|uniref:hypothetical protein n=1 Tax=Actinomadura sp. WMMA1423 TaxID=2591108 RepID=UPI0011468C7F|nr:hypothetical protein [Actinomadura sp. WMMA1423]
MSEVALPLKVVLDGLTIAEVPVRCELSTVWEAVDAAPVPVRRVQAIVHASTLADNIAGELRKLADTLETRPSGSVMRDGLPATAAAQSRLAHPRRNPHP